MPGNFDEALVERQIVPDGVLPALFVVPVVREVGHDVLVDPVQGKALLWRAPYRQHDHGIV